MNPLRRLIIPVIILLAIVSAGLLWYTRVEGWSMLDAGYMLVITLFTVGFEEVHSLSDPGRIFTMILIVGGVGTALYSVGQFGEMVVEGHILGYRRKKGMEKHLQSIKDHYIISGFGRVGHQVLGEMVAANIPCAVVDAKIITADELEAKNVPYIVGDPTANGNLENAGIKRAKGLLACADSDMENVFVTLSARAANPSIYIVARASGKDSAEKLRMAGANRVVAPYFISGKRMAALALKPVASDFLDMVMHGEQLEFSLQEIAVPEKSPLSGKTLAEAQIRQKSGATVLAIRKPEGSFDLQPLADSKIERSDVLVVIGTQEQLDKFEKMVG